MQPDPDGVPVTARGAWWLALAALFAASFALAVSLVQILTPADPLPKLGVCVIEYDGVETPSGGVVIGLGAPASDNGVVSCATGEWRSVVPQEYHGA